MRDKSDSSPHKSYLVLWCQCSCPWVGILVDHQLSKQRQCMVCICKRGFRKVVPQQVHVSPRKYRTTQKLPFEYWKKVQSFCDSVSIKFTAGNTDRWGVEHLDAQLLCAVPEFVYHRHWHTGARKIFWRNRMTRYTKSGHNHSGELWPKPTASDVRKNQFDISIVGITG